MKLIVKGELISLNEYINKERGNRYAAATIKREETQRVYWECKSQKLKTVKNPVVVEFQWFCKNTRKDPDNIGFGRKFILDGLVLAKVLPSDRWETIKGFFDVFIVDKLNPRVEVIMHETKKEAKDIQKAIHIK